MAMAAEKIAESRGIFLPPEVLSSYGACREWLDQQMKLPPPPTPAMVELAEELAEQAEESLPKEVFEDFISCRDWLNKRLSSAKRCPDE